MIEVPEVLKSAFAERRTEQATSPTDELTESRVVAGDLRIVTPLSHQQTDSRIVLVLKVDEPDNFADVMLVHSATELATDHDAIVLADDSAAPYDVVVQTDLRSAVWTYQIGSRVGHLSEEFVDTIKTWATDCSDEALARRSMAGIHNGTRLAGLVDRRWAFKESEGIALRCLASDCIEALLDHGHVWRVDPAVLRPDLLDLADDREALLSELVHWAATRTLSLTDDDVELLLMAGALEVDSWIQFGDLGADVLMSLQEVFLAGATGVRVIAEVGQSGFVTARHLDPVADPTERVHYLGANELVPS